MVTCLPISSGQRHQNSDVNHSTTYPVTHYSGGVSDVNIVRGADRNMLWLQQNRTPESSMPKSEESERIRHDDYHGIMG